MMTVALTALCVLVALGVPIAFAMMVATMIFFLANDVELVGFAHRICLGSENFILVAVPFFIFAALLMNAGGLTRRIIRFAEALLGHWPGSLAQVNIAASMINSGITGSSLADAAGVGGILIPEMVRKGYSPAFSATVTASAATIGPIIPPSIPFVLYGSIAGVSISALFLAGAIPGLLVGGALMVATRIISVRRGYEKGRRASLAEILTSLKDALLALGMPAVILGGIGGGIFTATEAAAVACFYALAVTGLLYRELTVKALMAVCRDTILLAIPPLIIIVAMSAFSMMLGWQQIPQEITAWVLAQSSSNLGILVLIVGLFFLFGLVTDGFPIFWLVTPMLIPIAAAVNIDLVHLGVLVTVVVLLGNLTPPFGLLMFLSCQIAGCSVSTFAREAWPYIVAIGLIVVLLILVPQIVLILPHLLIGYPM